TIGKSSKVPVQQLSDGMSKAVQLGSLRGDERGCIPSESLDLTMSIVDECVPRRLDTDIDVSPPRKCVRFADGLPGRSLVDVCPIDFPVRRKQVPVHNKQVRNEQAVNVSDSVCSA
ncbi:unnamed protein product, partial [Laminaria digitata]